MTALLIKLQNIVKADLAYHFRGGFWLTLGNIVSLFLSLVLGVVFANRLPQEIYGKYNYILSVTNILALFSLTGMNTAITRAVAQGFYGSIRYALVTRVRWGFWGSAMGIILAVYYSFANDFLLATAFFFAAFFIPFVDTLGTYDPILQGKKEFKKATVYSIISQASVSLVLLFMLIAGKGLIVIVATYFLSNFVIHLVFLKKTLSQIDLDSQGDKETVGYGKHLSVQGSLAAAVTYLDVALVFFLLGPVNAAIYAVALFPTEQIKSVFKNIYSLSVPKFATRELADIKRVLSRQATVVFWLSLVAAIGYVAMAPFLFKLFFPAYFQSVLYTQLLAISFLSFPVFLPLSLMQSHAMTRKLYTFNFLSPLMQIGLFFFLIPAFGLLGAVSAKIAGRLFNAWLVFWLLDRS